jgi:RimJ/RimL family protein N-acetyltransferase
LQYNLLQHNIRAHLNSLSDEDKRLRFGNTVTKDVVDKYVQSIDLNKDICLATFSSDLQVTGFLHIARISEGTAELGISVLEAYRKKGIATDLLGRGITKAKLLGINKLYMNCLAENTIMQYIAKRKLGIAVVTKFAENEVAMGLSRPTVYDLASDALFDQFSIIDYTLKHNLRKLYEVQHTIGNLYDHY